MAILNTRVELYNIQEKPFNRISFIEENAEGNKEAY
jgi:hypothetical protein